MAQDTLTARGVNGQIKFEGHQIHINRKGAMGFLTQGLKGTKEILISQISSIQFKPTGLITSGYIQFAFMGGREAKGGLFQATQDENTVMFTKKQQPDFEQLKAAIDKRRAELTQQPKVSSAIDELEKLAMLKEKGHITDEEFQLKKRQLLGL